MYSAEDLIQYTHRLKRLWEHIEKGGAIDVFTMRLVNGKMCFYGYTPDYGHWWNPIGLFFVPPHHELDPEIAKDYIRIEDFRDTNKIGQMYFPQMSMMVPYASRYRFANPIETTLNPNSPNRKIERILAEKQIKKFDERG